MIKAPPSASRAKNAKRMSAPPKSLNYTLKNRVIANNNQQQQKPQKPQQAQDDLLDLFGFGNNSNNNNNQNVSNGNTNNNNQTDDIFGLFGDNNNNNQNNNNNSNSNSNNNNNNNNLLGIHPNLANPRASASLQPDKLFDVSMWQNFDDNTNQTQTQTVNGSGNKPRNTTMNFEPININKNAANPKPKPKPNNNNNNSNIDYKKADNKDLAVASPIKKIRATAPPSTIASTVRKIKKADAAAVNKAAVKKAAAVVDEKETNALSELHRGAALLKYPRRSGFPHFKHIQLSSDNLRIQWFSRRKNLSETCIWIRDIREVVRGQETDVFKKFHQKTLEKSSFSIVYGHSYRTLDVAAKSIDECEMWVKCILKLVNIYKKNKKDSDLRKLNEIYVGIIFKDRNRPMSRNGSGNFIRANSSKNLKIDPVALKEIERDMENLHKTYHKTAQLSQKKQIIKSTEYSNIQFILSELEERIEELTYEVANIRDTELAKREVWRANVDLTAILEKVEVLIKHSSSSRRKSNFL